MYVYTILSFKWSISVYNESITIIQIVYSRMTCYLLIYSVTRQSCAYILEYLEKVKFKLIYFSSIAKQISAYINHVRCLLPGVLTSTHAACVEKSWSQNMLITGLELGTFGTRGRRSTSATRSSTHYSLYLPLLQNLWMLGVVHDSFTF